MGLCTSTDPKIYVVATESDAELIHSSWNRLLKRGYSVKFLVTSLLERVEDRLDESCQILMEKEKMNRDSKNKNNLNSKLFLNHDSEIKSNNKDDNLNQLLIFENRKKLNQDESEKQNCKKIELEMECKNNSHSRKKICLQWEDPMHRKEAIDYISKKINDVCKLEPMLWAPAFYFLSKRKSKYISDSNFWKNLITDSFLIVEAYASQHNEYWEKEKIIWKRCFNDSFCDASIEANGSIFSDALKAVIESEGIQNPLRNGSPIPENLGNLHSHSSKNLLNLMASPSRTHRALSVLREDRAARAAALMPKRLSLESEEKTRGSLSTSSFKYPSTVHIAVSQKKGKEEMLSESSSGSKEMQPSASFVKAISKDEDLTSSKENKPTHTSMQK